MTRTSLFFCGWSAATWLVLFLGRRWECAALSLALMFLALVVAAQVHAAREAARDRVLRRLPHQGASEPRPNPHWVS